MMKRLIGLGLSAITAATMLGATPASAADASLNVVHGIPGVQVEVCVDGAVAISGFAPGDVVTGVPLPAGTYDVKIVAGGEDCDAAAILESDGVELAAGKDYTAVAYLAEDGAPQLGLFKNNTKALPSGKSRLTVRHTAAAPAVDVFANGTRILTDVPNGASATLKVPTGIYATWAALPGDYRPVIGPDVLRLQKGMAYQVYAWGSASAGYGFAVVALDVGTK